MNTPAQRLRDEADAIRSYIDSRRSTHLVWQRLGSAERGLRCAADLFEQQRAPLLALHALCTRLIDTAAAAAMPQDVADLHAAVLELDLILGAGRKYVHSRDAIPEFKRTSGAIACPGCNRPLWQHPMHHYTSGESDPAPLILARNCVGDYLKL